ncbi:hypothetical protein EWM64_g39 [Hericium alpestre]|uniref:Uncharacterized protein n=1 Tax=Hericium alpestre TaxID=135208 RepID=A0A4Z0ADD1_9AGAM|nr:hypothetical protein EWM64_g39 [Hericium alpestre]
MLFLYYITMAALGLFSVVQFQEVPDDGSFTIGSGSTPYTFFRRITHMARRRTVVRRRSAPVPVLVFPIFLPFHPGNGTGDVPKPTHARHTQSTPRSIAAPRPTQHLDNLLPEGMTSSNLSLSKMGSPLTLDCANLSMLVDYPVVWGPVNMPLATEPSAPFFPKEHVSPPVPAAPHTLPPVDQTVPPPDASSGMDCPDGWTHVETVHYRIFRRTEDTGLQIVGTPPVRHEDIYVDDSPLKKATRLWFINNYNSIVGFLTSEYAHAVMTLCLKFAVFGVVLGATCAMISAGYSSLVKWLDGKTKSTFDPFDFTFGQDGLLLEWIALQTDPTNILNELPDQVKQPFEAFTSKCPLFPPPPANQQCPPLPFPLMCAPQEKPLEKPVDGAGGVDSGKLSSTQPRSDRLKGPQEEPSEKAQEKSVDGASKLNFDFSNPAPTMDATESSSISENASVGIASKAIIPDSVPQNGVLADTPESATSAAGIVPTEDGQHLPEKESTALASSTEVTSSAGKDHTGADSVDSMSTIKATQAAEVVEGATPPTADPNDTQAWTTVSSKKNKKNKKNKKGQNKEKNSPVPAEPAPQ